MVISAGILSIRPQPQGPSERPYPLPRGSRLQLVPLKGTPAGDHSTSPYQEPCLPALERTHPQSSESPPSPHQVSMPRVGGDRQPGLCPVVLVYHLGPAFLEPGSALAIWGLCTATPFPAQPPWPCPPSEAPQTTGQRTRWPHPRHDPQRAWPV